MEKCSNLDVIVNPDVTIDGDYCIPDNKNHVNIQRRVQIIDMSISNKVTDTCSQFYYEAGLLKPEDI